MRKVPGSPDHSDSSVAREVGASLRRARLGLGLSLHDVESKSSHEFKASVLGAYERGDRAISVARLHRLALVYGVSIEALLPHAGPPRVELEDSVEIDLPSDLDARLAAMDAGERERVVRFVQMIRSQRQGGDDTTTKAIRAEDVRAIELLLPPPPEGSDPEQH